jgi:ribosomal protein L11 methyltransferase
VSVVVAAVEREVARVQTRLRDLGVSVSSVAAPSDARRLILAEVDDEGEEGRLVEILCREGMVAVSRPAGGDRLDAWVRHTRPISFGDRLGVCFAWSEHERPDVARLIEIGPGGWSAQHPSTRLLIDQLLGRLRGGERVLDVGCGSGVLGLCALALGATHVVAVDIKPNAIEATRCNAALNGMERCLDVALGPLAQVDGTFDVVLANVGRAGLVELGPQLAERVAPDGWLGASGISPSQCSLVAGFLRPLEELERRTSDAWAALVLGRRD